MISINDAFLRFPKKFQNSYVKEQSFFHAVGTPEETDGYSKIGYR